ncbi:MAG: MBL fold metallo-hydrolase [Paracoccus sp. (in: a-proteobacteria)]|nr:MBL fold metallo-hydrolase [Paracoccus sp. (in: a-proteobacteria)]
MTTRRQILTLTALGLTLPLLPRQVFASSTLDLGNWRLETLSDGHLMMPVSFAFAGLPEDVVQATMARHDLSADGLTPPCNVTVLRGGDRVVLFDVGAGPDFMSSTGRLPEALAASDLTPEDITDIVITHGHPDHLWGILDDFDEPRFPDARILMGAQEHAYWTDPATADSIGEERASFYAGASRRLSILGDGVELFDDGDEVLPGITARLTPGHTPGHMSFLVSGDQPVMIVGDAIGNHHLAFDDPALPSPSDQDPELATRTRLALLSELSQNGMAVIGFHLPDGGIGRIEAKGSAYRFLTI